MPLLQPTAQATKVSTPLASPPRMNEYVAYRQGGGTESFEAWKTANPEPPAEQQAPDSSNANQRTVFARIWRRAEGLDAQIREIHKLYPPNSEANLLAQIAAYNEFIRDTGQRSFQTYSSLQLNSEIKAGLPQPGTPEHAEAERQNQAIYDQVSQDPNFMASMSGGVSAGMGASLSGAYTPTPENYMAGHPGRDIGSELTSLLRELNTRFHKPGMDPLGAVFQVLTGWNPHEGFPGIGMISNVLGGGSGGQSASSNYAGEGGGSGGGVPAIDIYNAVNGAINSGDRETPSIPSWWESLGADSADDAYATPSRDETQLATELRNMDPAGAGSDDHGWQQDWWKDLGYPGGPQGLLDAREDGWRKSETDTDPVWDENNIYGDGLQRNRAYRDPITGEVRPVDGRDAIDPIGPFRVPIEILTAGGAAIWDWVSRNNDHISRESVFRRDEPRAEEPPAEQEPILGPAVRVDENGEVTDEEPRSVFRPPVITPPVTGPEPPRWDDEPEKKDPPGVIIPQLGEPPTSPGGGDNEEPERRESPLILQPITGPTPPREEFDWDEWERQRQAEEERRRANIGGRVDLGTTGNKLKYREGYAGFAGGETGRSVFSGPGRYNNPFTNRGSS